MALDPYDPCPCGSGKKFKWCCEPIYAGIQRAYEQERNGQHDAALRVMDQVIAEHADNPEAYGRKAELLYTNGRYEEAENTLQKAFDLNPNYPFGLYLRAAVRFQEGETIGALLLARKAAEAYDPSAKDMLFQVYALVAEAEMARNCPVAVRAAMQYMMHLQPADEEIRQRFEAIFGEASDLPACSRREYALLSLPQNADPARKERWMRAAAPFTATGAGRLSDAAKTYEAITREDPNDALAWYNLGVGRAWLGDNPQALPALEKFQELTDDEGQSTTAALLGEVLRCGRGLEEQSDYKTFAFQTQLRNVDAANALLQEWLQTRRLLPIQTQQQGVLMGMILDYGHAGLITAGTPVAEVGRLSGYLTIIQDLMQVSSPMKEPLEKLRDEVRTRFALGLTELPIGTGPVQFHNVVAEALVFPVRQASEQAGKELVLSHVQKFYEDQWVHRPRLSLNNTAPVDAAGHPKLRHKVRAVVQFVQDCAQGGVVADYDFNRLRRKLGLDGAAPTPGTAAAAATQTAAAAPKLDIPGMGAAELGGLAKEELTDEQLEQAYQAAHKIDAGELAAHFARQLVARPATAERADRYPWYNFLIQYALKEGDLPAALAVVDEGQKADEADNAGKRFADYEVRRGQILVKQGDLDRAAAAFGNLIAREPNVLKYRGMAAEALLSKAPAAALKFAEEGLAAARTKGDRDSENYLRELQDAARRQMTR